MTIDDKIALRAAMMPCPLVMLFWTASLRLAVRKNMSVTQRHYGRAQRNRRNSRAPRERRECREAREESGKSLRALRSRRLLARHTFCSSSIVETNGRFSDRLSVRLRRFSRARSDLKPLIPLKRR
jgi:hypothetical protein